MDNADFLFYNGKTVRSDKLLISPNNRSFRYGDGFFETIKWANGAILHEKLHLERLFHSLETLQFIPPTYFNASYIINAINSLIQKNQHHFLARVRITIFRGEGGIYDQQNHFPNLIIQTWDLNPSNNHLNENGMDIGIFKLAVKSADHYSSLKTNNYLSYVMGALWAKEQHLNDAILLNSDGNIADSTIANVFIVINGRIKTPALSEGPVAGIMRRFLINQLKMNNYEVEEGVVSVEEMQNANEIWLTNAIYGIRWVKQIGIITYTNKLASKIFDQIL
jgi:branched-chain amino acid aminotransferase